MQRNFEKNCYVKTGTCYLKLVTKRTIIVIIEIFYREVVMQRTIITIKTIQLLPRHTRPKLRINGKNSTPFFLGTKKYLKIFKSSSNHA